MNITQVFALRLKYLRELRGLSQEELSKHASLDRSYISELERGLKSPTLKTLESLGDKLGVKPRSFLRTQGSIRPQIPTSYHVREDATHIKINVGGDHEAVNFPVQTILDSVNDAHDLIDEMYDSDLDIAGVLGMRNLSGFIGELLVSAVTRRSKGGFVKNPHQDGYPDLLLMNEPGRTEWNHLEKANQLNEKEPFSPFSPFGSGGIEVKATCGKVPSPKECAGKTITRPDLGDTRIGCLKGYDWKAHHQETNNLLGTLWDFIDRKPRVVALFYSNNLSSEDWSDIVKPKDGGGKTTSVSIMRPAGISKMYEGWLCVLKGGEYAEFLNKKNKSDQIPTE